MSSLKSPAKSTEMQQDATRRYSEKNEPKSGSHITSLRQGLSQRQLNAIPILLQGLSDAQVAQQIGVDRATIFRWRKDAKFLAELERQRKVIWQQSVARLQSMLEPALNIIQKQMIGDNPKTALRAASILLRIATPARLERLADATDSSDRNAKANDPLMEKLEAYLNAPLPDGTQLKGERFSADEDED